MSKLMTVVSNNQIADAIFELKVHGDLTKNMKKPGQFVHIKAGTGTEHMLRRPISICEVNREEGTFTMLFRREGHGTEMISTLKSGDPIDVIAPLGNGFPVEEAQNTALLVGGGIGVPPLYELSKQLNQRGIKTIHVLGFQSDKDAFYIDEFNALGETYIATVDGSLGTKGFVTTVIDHIETPFDIFYSCGPKAMLKALTEQLSDVKGYISLEERMGCGIGACYACVCHTDDEAGYVKVCTDGPVFEKGAVVI